MEVVPKPARSAAAPRPASPADVRVGKYAGAPVEGKPWWRRAGHADPIKADQSSITNSTLAALKQVKACMTGVSSVATLVTSVSSSGSVWAICR